MVEGEAEISISIIAHYVYAGQMLLLPAGQPHALKAVTKFKMILVMIKT
jgi:quercetin dioxygenase-like cupin family protein